MIKSLPVFDFNDLKDSIGRIVKNDTFETRVYWYKNQVLYQREYQFTDFSSKDSLPKIEKRYYSFVYTSGTDTGLFFDSNKNIYNKAVKVDSMLKRLRQHKLEVEDLNVEMNTTYVSTTKLKGNQDFEELYTFKGKKDSTMTGTVVFSFTDNEKFKNIDYSFSKELDSIRNKKLYKIVVVTDARFIPAPNNIYMDKGEVFYLLEKIVVSNPGEKMKYFEEDRKRRKLRKNN